MATWPLHPFQFEACPVASRQPWPVASWEPGSIHECSYMGYDRRWRQPGQPAVRFTYYVPTAAEATLIKRRYGEVEHPPWHRIQADIMATGRMSESMRDLTAPAIVGLLDGKTPAKVGEGKSWKEVQKELERYVKTYRWSSRRALAKTLGCSTGTVGKAVKASAYLKAREAEHKARARKGREVQMTDAVYDRTRRGNDPSDTADLDAVTNRLLQDAKPEERARINELDAEGRRVLAKAYAAQEEEQTREERQHARRNATQ